MKLAPERMLRMNLLTLNETAQPLTGLIASEGCVHLCRSNLPSVSEKGGAGEPGVSRLDELAGLMGRTGELMRWLDMVPDEGNPVPLQSILGMDTDQVVSNAEDSLEALHGKVSGYFRKQEDQETSMIRLDEISEQMNLLHDNGLSFAELDSFSHFYAVCGTVEDSQKARLENMLLEMDCAVSMRPSHGGGSSFILIGDREKQDRFDSILSQTGVRVSNPPERYLSPFEDALEQVELELWQLRDSMAELRMYYQRELPEWKSELARLHRILEVHDLLARTVSDLETDGTISLISGFVPVDRRESLVRRLDEQLGDKYYARFESVEVSPDEEIPTLLHNRGIFRPFELFVKTYGLPGYNDIDPTPFVAVSFLLMFGMMFGDVGHGMILAGIGACIAYLRYRIFDGMRDLGRILMMAGLSGTVFGFLFGSVFGIEDDSVLPALWMRPSHSGNLTTFMSVAVVIGIGIISTGIVLNIIQSIRRRNFRKAVLGQWSAASLIFFWVLLVMLGLQISGKDIGFSPVIMAAVAARGTGRFSSGNLRIPFPRTRARTIH